MFNQSNSSVDFAVQPSLSQRACLSRILRVCSASRLAVSLLALFTGSCLVAGAAAGVKPFFETTSAGFIITWSKKNLAATAADPTQILFSAKAVSLKEKTPKKDKTTEDRTFTLLSVVGPILSYQDERSLDWPGMAHPGVGDVRKYEAVDLRTPKKQALLTDYFAPEDVYAALMNNKIIKAGLTQNKVHPKNLADLVKALQDAVISVTDPENGDTNVSFPPHMLGHFCFNSLNKDAANVSLSLYDQGGNQIKPLDITLIAKNADLLKWLEAADQKKAGILAKRTAVVTKDAETDFHFDP